MMMMVSGCFNLKNGNDTADLGMMLPDLAGGGGDDAGCWDNSGFGGKGCFKCTPMTRDEIVNACTPSTCVAYDNTALPLDPDGGLPPLPQLDLAIPIDMAQNNADLNGVSPPPGPDMAGIPACSSLSGGNVVYATGSSAAGLFLGNIAQPLEHATPPVAIVYQSPGSCVGISAQVTPSTTKMTGNAVYWDPNTAVDPSQASAQLTCYLDPAGVNADIGFSDVFAQSCVSLPAGLDPSIKDFFGPVQIMNFIVPQNSSANNISAEAGYFVYGFGAESLKVTPWTDPNQIFQRNASSGTQAMIAATIGVNAKNWIAKATSGSGDIRTKVINAGSAGQTVANTTLGILSSDGLDPFRANLHGLAFQDYNQRCGFYPDSTAMAVDKANVRDGHYTIFGPLHMLAHVNQSGVPTNTNAARVLDAITGVNPPSGVDIIDLFAKHSLIPQCAMSVTRDSDGGEIKPFKPATACSCYYTERATGLVPPPGCTQCSTPTDCPPATPNCNKFAAQSKGYCER